MICQPPIYLHVSYICVHAWNTICKTQEIQQDRPEGEASVCGFLHVFQGPMDETPALSPEVTLARGLCLLYYDKATQLRLEFWRRMGHHSCPWDCKDYFHQPQKFNFCLLSQLESVGQSFLLQSAGQDGRWSLSLVLNQQPLESLLSKISHSILQPRSQSQLCLVCQ